MIDWSGLLPTLAVMGLVTVVSIVLDHLDRKRVNRRYEAVQGVVTAGFTGPVWRRMIVDADKSNKGRSVLW